MISDNKADKLSCEWAPTGRLLPNLLGRTSCLNEVASMLNACSLAVVSSTLCVYHSTMAISKALLSTASPFIYVGSLGFIEISGKYINFSQALGHQVQATAYIVATAASLAGIIAPHLAIWVHTELNLAQNHSQLPLHAPSHTCIKSVPIAAHTDVWSCDWTPTASLLPRIVNRDSCANEIAGIVNAFSLPIISACCAIYHFGMAPTKLALRILSPFVYCGTLGSYHLREKHITMYEVVGHSLKGCAYVAGTIAACAAFLFPQFTLSAHDTLGLIVPVIVPGRYVDQDDFFDNKTVENLTHIEGADSINDRINGVNQFERRIMTIYLNEHTGQEYGKTSDEKESVEVDLSINQATPTEEDIKSRRADPDFDSCPDVENSNSYDNTVRPLRRNKRMSKQHQINRLKKQLKKINEVYEMALLANTELALRNKRLNDIEMHMRNQISVLTDQKDELNDKLLDKDRLIELLSVGGIENQTKMKDEIANSELQAQNDLLVSKIENLNYELGDLKASSKVQSDTDSERITSLITKWKDIERSKFNLELENKELLKSKAELNDKVFMLRKRIEELQKQLDDQCLNNNSLYFNEFNELLPEDKQKLKEGSVV